jgi:hypothetical protein
VDVDAFLLRAGRGGRATYSDRTISTCSLASSRKNFSHRSSSRQRQRFQTSQRQEPIHPAARAPAAVGQYSAQLHNIDTGSEIIG